MATWKSKVRSSINHLLSPAGYELVRYGQRDYAKPFLPFWPTLKKASKAKMSVGEYIDATYQRPGATQANIDKLVELGILTNKVRNICEIGPGSGRYLEKVMRICTPETYEIYETASAWSDWLAKEHRVMAHKPDGKTLGQTKSDSVDLVHAHGVFIYVPFLVSWQYFAEMIRVARPGGHIVFDIFTPACFPDSMIEKYISVGIYDRSMIPAEFAVDYFARRQCSLLHTFFGTMVPGQTQYHIFVKNGG